MKKEYDLSEIGDNENFENVIINRCEDFGPATKLFPVLLDEKLDPETIIITVDDDVIYHPETVAHLIKYSTLIPDSVVCNSGWNYVNLGFLKLPLIKLGTDPSTVKILQGDKGVTYRKKFFKDMETLENKIKEQSCDTLDDLSISCYLKTKGIKIVCVPMQHDHQYRNENNKLSHINLTNNKWASCINTLNNCP